MNYQPYHPYHNLSEQTRQLQKNYYITRLNGDPNLDGEEDNEIENDFK